MKFFFKHILIFALFVIHCNLVFAQDDNGTLDVMTWNLEHFGNPTNGPTNGFLQRKYASDVIKNLKPDVIAVEEIYNEEEFNLLIDRLDGYEGYLANYMTGSQKVGFIIKSAAIQRLSDGELSRQDAYAWAYRKPFYLYTNYTISTGEQIRIRFIGLHAKANIGSSSEQLSSYNRRVDASEDLYNQIVNHMSTERIIVLGDYNDDVDESIYNERFSPYAEFVNDQDNFKVLSKDLSDSNKRSTVSYSEMIDHIMITNEIKEEMLGYTIDVHNPESYVPNYENSTSDHYPVIANIRYVADTAVDDEKSDLPNEISLSNYPNPFNPSTTIKYSISEASQISLGIYDTRGRLVNEYDLGYKNKGSHTYSIVAPKLASGVYIYTLRMNGRTVVRSKMTLLK